MVQDQCKTGICRLHCVISTIIEITLIISYSFEYSRNRSQNRYMFRLYSKHIYKSNINKTLQLKFTVEKYIYLTHCT